MSKELPLRTVAFHLDTDQAILSKMERGLRPASREQVVRLAGYFKVKEADLLAAWLSEKLVDALGQEEVAFQALQLAEAHMVCNIKPPRSKASILRSIKAGLGADGRVSSAWVFGSFARGDERPDSDIDIMVELTSDKLSMFDLADIAHRLERRVHRKIDLVEKGGLKDFAARSAHHEMVKIYG